MGNIIILHGWGHDQSFWTEATKQFGENVTVIDLPGFGKEPLISSDWGIPEYSRWTTERITDLGINHVVLLGHSFGGRIAAYITSEQPQWLKALILYGAPCLYRPSIKIRLKIKIAKLNKHLRLKSKTTNPELNEADRNGLGKIFRKVVTFDQTGSLPSIKVPTLLIWGENDLEVPVSIATEINKLIPGSKLVILDNLGHNAHLQNPYLFYGSINKFIQSL